MVGSIAAPSRAIALGQPRAATAQTRTGPYFLRQGDPYTFDERSDRNDFLDSGRDTPSRRAISGTFSTGANSGKWSCPIFDSN